MNRDQLLADIAVLECVPHDYNIDCAVADALDHVLPILRTLAELDEDERHYLVKMHELGEADADRDRKEAIAQCDHSGHDAAVAAWNAHRIAAKLFSGEP